MSQVQTTTRSIKIAICQFDVLPPPNPSTPSSPTTTTTTTISSDREPIGSEQVDHQIINFERAKRFILRAAAEGARLIIFPEYSITGLIDNHLHLASNEFEWIKKFQTLAIENRIDIIPGTIVEDGLTTPELNLHPSTSHPHRSLFNSAYYINKDGEIVAKYRKKNLWHSEKYLTPCPHDHQVFEALDGLRIGLLICWDLAWPEAFRQLMKQKVDLIIIPSYWTLDHPGSKMIKYDRLGSNESKLIDSLILSRALESESCIIFVNCAGKQEDGFLGRSTVCLPLKGDLIKFDRPVECYESIELDLDELKEVLNVLESFPPPPPPPPPPTLSITTISPPQKSTWLIDHLTLEILSPPSNLPSSSID